MRLQTGRIDSLWRIAPAQAIEVQEGFATQDPHDTNSRLPMALRKEGTDTRHPEILQRE